MLKIRIPNGWAPRAYQMPLWRALEGGTKRALCIWHRPASR
jgi:phage terminase large subunit